MKIVKIQDVKDRLADIALLAETDDEAAHSMEDKLYRDVLYTIANIADHDKGYLLAELALSTRRLDFNRWCA